MSREHSSDPLGVLIAGGGVAALEGALALRELAGERVRVTLLAPEADFSYRPMRVGEPFGHSTAREYPLEEVAADNGAEHVQDSFKSLDAAQSQVHTEHGRTLRYDALLLAVGARLGSAFPHALTIDDRRLDEQLHGLIQDLEEGYVRSLAFLVPSPAPWPLAVYELALMSARRAYETQAEVAITIVTPESAPLAVFGGAVSEAVERLLAEHRITTITSAYCDVLEPGVVAVHPGSRTLSADRIVALPRLFGSTTPGVPSEPQGGFIPVDPHCRVRGLERVWAAGDATDFAIKHGGLAAQQADAAAQDIAALAGAPIEPSPFHPEIRAVLLGAGKPLYLSAQITGGHGSTAHATEQPDRSSGPKISARYLAPYLESRDRRADRALP